MAKRKESNFVRWTNLAGLAVAAFVGIGYLPSYLMHSPVLSIPLACGAMVLVAAKLGRPLRGFFAGAALGAICGAAIAGGLASGQQIPPQQFTPFMFKYLAAVAGLCAVIGLVFGYTALRRRQQTQR